MQSVLFTLMLVPFVTLAQAVEFNEVLFSETGDRALFNVHLQRPVRNMHMDMYYSYHSNPSIPVDTLAMFNDSIFEIHSCADTWNYCVVAAQTKAYFMAQTHLSHVGIDVTDETQLLLTPLRSYPTPQGIAYTYHLQLFWQSKQVYADSLQTLNIDSNTLMSYCKFGFQEIWSADGREKIGRKRYGARLYFDCNSQRLLFVAKYLKSKQFSELDYSTITLIDPETQQPSTKEIKSQTITETADDIYAIIPFNIAK